MKTLILCERRTIKGESKVAPSFETTGGRSFEEIDGLFAPFG